MKKSTVMGVVGVALLSSAVTVSAEVLFQQVVSGNYGQASGWTAEGFVAVNVSVNGSDTATLVTSSNSYADGYKFWYGQIPASAVTVRGANSISVQFDTCSIQPSDGCGYVDATFSADPREGGFITDGSLHYNWDGLIQTVAGPTQVRVADVTGFVNGVALDGARAFVGKYTQASIMIETAQ